MYASRPKRLLPRVFKQGKQEEAFVYESRAQAMTQRKTVRIRKKKKKIKREIKTELL